MIPTTVGSINERGYLKGFKRRGYTNAKCLLELVANSLDSIDRGGEDGVIRFDIGVDEIRMSDNGEGMDHTGLAAMFDLHRENHGADKSRGVSGIGAKPALSNLSGDRNMTLLTHKKDGEYLKVMIPWANIHHEGQYTAMVRVSPMVSAEAAAFGTVSGTTIVFPYSDSLYTLIRDNFAPIDEDENTLVAPLDRIGVVFGRDTTRIEYVHHNEPDRVCILPKYNYFADAETDYYLGIRRGLIEHWYSNTEGLDRFICENQEIVRSGRGWSKEPCERQTNMTGFIRVGEYRLLVGLHRDVAIFDEELPVVPTADNKHQNSYNTAHLGSNNKEYLAFSKLVRNDQTIGLIPLADKNIANARANGKEFIAIQLMQCEVRFNPVSAQDNRQDNIMGIQENKNQFDGDSLPLNFTRLVKSIRMQKAEEIWKYFEQRVAAIPSEPVALAPALAPAPAPAPAPALSLAPALVPEEETETETPISESATVISASEELQRNGADIRTRLTKLVFKIKSSVNYAPEILAHVVALENCF